MPKKLVIFSLLLVLALAGGLALIFWPSSPSLTDPTSTSHPAKPDSRGPVLAVSPAEYNFGQVIYGQVARQTFQITNTGDQPLEIQRLSTSCGCTQAFMAETDKIIAPGQAVELVVTFDPAVHKDDTDLGELTRVVYIRSNDPQRPEAEINLKANVIKK